MIDIRSMGYVRVASTDPEQWTLFAGKVLGLAEGRGPNADHQYWRIDEVSARLVVFPADVDQLDCVGWELADHAALQSAREHLDKAGVEVEEGTREELLERRVQELVRFRDPFDNVFELFHGITYEARPVVTPYAARFVTGDQGMGHIVLPVTDDVAALEFYRDTLGFRLRDSMSMPGEFVGREPGSKVWLRFLGVNARHHSLAFLPMPNPSKCVHIMLEVDELDHVGRALERVRKHQAPLSATLGRHMNDEMISFYVRSPGGFDIEFGTDGLTVDDGRWVARESTAVSYWGHDFGGRTVTTVGHVDQVPEGMREDARETWPSHDLIESWLGDSMYDFQFRPGEDTFVDADDPEAVAAARRFRDVLGRFASGVTVVTAISGGAPVGLTCQSFSSVSLNPPLVLFIPAKTSRAWPAIQRAGKFCVNFLAADQAELSNQMAGRGHDKFAGVSWQPAPATGSPMIDGTLGYVDCQIHHVQEAGDHYVVIGRVLDLGVHDPEAPLLFFEGKYVSTDSW